MLARTTGKTLFLDGDVARGSEKNNNMSNSHEQTIQKLVIVEDSEEINGIKSQVVTLPACMRGWWDGRTHPVA